MPRRWGDNDKRTGSIIDPSDILTDKVLGGLKDLMRMDCMVSASMSRDHGACSVAVTFGGKMERDWFRSEADAILRIDEWLGLIGDERGDGPPPVPAGKPPSTPPGGRGGHGRR